MAEIDIRAVEVPTKVGVHAVPHGRQSFVDVVLLPVHHTHLLLRDGALEEREFQCLWAHWLLWLHLLTTTRGWGCTSPGPRHRWCWGCAWAWWGRCTTGSRSTWRTWHRWCSRDWWCTRHTGRSSGYRWRNPTHAYGTTHPAHSAVLIVVWRRLVVGAGVRWRLAVAAVGVVASACRVC